MNLNIPIELLVIVFVVGIVLLVIQIRGWWSARDTADVHLSECQRLIPKLSAEAGLFYVKDTFESNGPFHNLAQLTNLVMLVSILVTTLGIAFLPTTIDSSSFLDVMLPRFLGVALGPVLAMVNMWLVADARKRVIANKKVAIDLAIARPSPAAALDRALDGVAEQVASLDSALTGVNTSLDKAATTINKCSDLVARSSSEMNANVKTITAELKLTLEAASDSIQQSVSQASTGLTEAHQSTITSLYEFTKNGFELMQTVVDESKKATKDAIRAIEQSATTANDKLKSQAVETLARLDQLQQQTAQLAQNAVDNFAEAIATKMAEMIRPTQLAVQQNADELMKNVQEHSDELMEHVKQQSVLLTQAVQQTEIANQHQATLASELPERSREVFAAWKQTGEQLEAAIQSMLYEIQSMLHDLSNVSEAARHTSVSTTSNVPGPTPGDDGEGNVATDNAGTETQRTSVKLSWRDRIFRPSTWRTRPRER